MSNTEIAAIINAMNSIFANLIKDLDARGVLSKDDFADQLEPAYLNQPMIENGASRLDRLCIQNLVQLLRNPPDQQGVRLQVIEGGLSDDKEPQN